MTVSRGLMAALGQPETWPPLLVKWELALIGELGFGLDLSACAATRARANLRYVSPKSGRAVSADAGAPYHDKLLPLPPFLAGDPAPPSRAEILRRAAADRLFPRKVGFAPGEIRVPNERLRLLQQLEKTASPLRTEKFWLDRVFCRCVFALP